jgi:tetratricopeptide (TPR) repeat protein
MEGAPNLTVMPQLIGRPRLRLPKTCQTEARQQARPDTSTKSAPNEEADKAQRRSCGCKSPKDEAISYQQRALALKPVNPTALCNLGAALRGQGRLNEAIARYEQALAIRPNYPEALSNLANALKDQGRLDEAIARYEQALVIRPNYPEVLCNLGVALAEKGKLGEAISRYEQAIALKPEYAETLCNLGVAFTQQANLTKALDCYDRAIVIKPDYAEAHSNRAFCLNYLDEVTPRELFSAHIGWHKQIRGVESLPTAYLNTRHFPPTESRLCFARSLPTLRRVFSRATVKSPQPAGRRSILLCGCGPARRRHRSIERIC